MRNADPQIGQGYPAVAQLRRGNAEQPGQHAVVYGERGVGKTSLVSVAAEVLAASGVVTARTTCDRSDGYESVWRKALGELRFTVTKP